MSVERPCLHPRANHQHGTHLAYGKDGCRCDPCAIANRRQSKATAYRTLTGTHTYVPADQARAHVTQLLMTLTVSQIEQRSGVHRTAIRVLVGDFPGRPASRRITRTTERALLAISADRVGGERHGLVDGTGTRRRFRALVALGWPIDQLRRRLGFSTRTTWLLAHPRGGDSYPVRATTVHAIRALYDELSLTIPPQSRAATRARTLAASNGWLPPLAWDDDTIDDPAAEPVADRRSRRLVHADDVEWLIDAGGTIDSIIVRLGVTKSGVYTALRRAGRHDLIDRLTEAMSA